MNITASQLNRAVRCLASITLPQEDSPNARSQQGSVLARYFQRCSEVGQEAALAEVPEEYASVAAAIDLDELPIGLAAEVAFAYNCRTGQAVELGRGIERRYVECLHEIVPGAALEEWAFVTVDVLGVSDDSVYVADHKSFTDEEPARDHLQIGMGAMCAAKVYGKKKATVAILRPHGNKRADEAQLEDFDLESVEWTVGGLWLQLVAHREGKLELEPKPGKHCKYCKAARACPVGGGAAMVLAKPVAFDWRAPVTRDNAAAWHKATQALEELLTQRRREVAELAKADAIDLGDGWILGEREKDGNEVLDPAISYEVVKESLGEEVADAACPRDFSKAALERALTAHKVKGKTKVKDQIVAKIRTAGGSKRGTRRVVEEYLKE